MPDRDIFEGCGSRKQRKALDSIYRDRDRSDPNVVQNTIAAAEERFDGLDHAIRQLADWVLVKSGPVPLFIDAVDAPFLALPIEVRAAFESAAHRAVNHCIGNKGVHSRQQILSQILAHAMVCLIAENSCATAMAQQELHLTAQDIRWRLSDLVTELVESSALSDFAARVVQVPRDEATDQLPQRRKRGRTTSMPDLLNISLTR